MMLHAHSLVAYIETFTVIFKVVKDPSRFNEDPETSEHHMPGIPAHRAAAHVPLFTCMYTVCVHVLVFMQIKLTGFAV